MQSDCSEVVDLQRQKREISRDSDLFYFFKKKRNVFFDGIQDTTFLQKFLMMFPPGTNYFDLFIRFLEFEVHYNKEGTTPY